MTWIAGAVGCDRKVRCPALVFSRFSIAPCLWMNLCHSGACKLLERNVHLDMAEEGTIPRGKQACRVDCEHARSMCEMTDDPSLQCPSHQCRTVMQWTPTRRDPADEPVPCKSSSNNGPGSEAGIARYKDGSRIRARECVRARPTWL